jgi:hypothetical protein
VQPFLTSREAKEFLVDKIVEQAQRDSIDLSEVERKMLYFSETAWSLPDIYEVNDEFERDCDQPEYEKKVTNIIHNFLKWSRKRDSFALTQWKAAIRKLKAEDHYILVMVGMAQGNILAINGSSPATPFLKLLLIAVIACCILFPIAFAVMFLINRLRS